jgi:hypothetical protein
MAPGRYDKTTKAQKTEITLGRGGGSRGVNMLAGPTACVPYGKSGRREECGES